MSHDEHVYRKSTNRWIWVSAGSAVLLGLFIYFLSTLSNPGWGDGELVVYCASGIRPPVEEAAAEFQERYGMPIRLEYGSSGALEGRLRLANEADLYIPADVSFSERVRQGGLLAESIPLGAFRLVLAYKPGNPKKIRSIDDLLRPDVNFVLCNQEAGAGKKTKKVLEKAGKWDAIFAAVKAEKPTVSDAANDVRETDSIDAGLVWNSTARQRGLEFIIPSELEPGTSRIVAAVTTRSKVPTDALRFARFLAAPSEGQKRFARHHYEVVDGDAWAETPKLRFYAGGVNRQAVEETLDWFQQREHCIVNVTYSGCGSLVQKIQASTNNQPDAFLTCDKSYMGMVETLFGTATDVSTTDVVIVVRSGNPKNIRKVEDLARNDVLLAIADPEKSALGNLSVHIFRDSGIFEAVDANQYKTAPTAHELMMMMESNDHKIDAIIVYQANCTRMTTKLETVSIDHPSALAIQNIAVGKSTKYPYLAKRLIKTILSRESQERFLNNGFGWAADKAARPQLASHPEAAQP